LPDTFPLVLIVCPLPVFCGGLGGTAIFVAFGALTWIWIRSGAANSSSECDGLAVLLASTGFCTHAFGLVVLALRWERGTCLQFSSVESLETFGLSLVEGAGHLR